MARDVGTERIPVTGERNGADFISGPFCYQLKKRRALPVWMFRWLSGICQTAGKDRVGVLVLSRPYHDRADALVCVRWADWVALHGEPPVTPEG